MTAEVVNLRRVRKGKAKADKANAAAANRAAFGQTLVERERTALDIARANNHLDGHRRESDDQGDGRTR